MEYIGKFVSVGFSCAQCAIQHLHEAIQVPYNSFRGLHSYGSAVQLFGLLTPDELYVR